ncbi:hypothetical protein LY625_12420 [Lysobacter sp. GX 14042]|uniref:hypothetical protein n=1 Tax=Lysobacter sp. GX 14042 TaxID=2907155 RepID=UPI001F2D923E|nr:hypothetical protein [Lysobacter sp. GX 14042]MCE7033406.1 hypothetical protein [Lysobacter sp. GX 14042]
MNSPLSFRPASGALLAGPLALALAACSPAPAPTTAGTTPDASTAEAPAATAQDAFFDNLTALCGNAYAGKVETDRPDSQGNNAFAGQALVVHVRECSDGEIRIPFHVGEDRSRTWIVTRTDEGLRLKHDHRLEDGSDDPVTLYGGDSASEGTANRQEFPVDAFSQEMFTREGMDVSNTNVWAIEVEPDVHYTYELGRTDQDRLFRVRFDLANPIDAPPAPWGHE